MPAAFDSDRTWEFAAPPAAVWGRIVQVDDYHLWWPWLRRFDPGPGVSVGAVWQCEVVPPLPYVVRFELCIDRIDEGRSIETTVRGDIRGGARLWLDDLPDGGTRAALVSSLAPAHPMLRGFGRVARPLVEWGHDWVLDQGRRQFVTNAFADDGGSERDRPADD